MKSSSMNIFALILNLFLLTNPILASKKLIKSLGREANLSEFYNYVKDEFLHISAFTEDFPTGTTEIVTRETYANMFSISGSREILNDFHLKTETVNAMVVYREIRCLERIKLGRCKLLNLYNPKLGKDNFATHVVTAVRWGAEVNFGVHIQVQERLKKTKFEQDIDAELQGYGAAVTSKSMYDVSASSWLKSSSFQSTYHGDIRVRNPLPTNFTQIVEIIQDFSAALNATRGGKGQRIYYIVKPIDEVSRSFQCKRTTHAPLENATANLSTEDYWLEKLQRQVLKLYYKFEETADLISDLNKKATSHEIVLSSSVLAEIGDMFQKYDDCRSDFSAIVRKCIVELRAEKNNGSLSEMKSAMKVFQNESLFYKQLAKEKDTLLTHKISDRTSVGENAVWAKQGENVQTYLRKYTTGRVFILFVKELWRKSNEDKFEDGFLTLLTLGGQKVIIDCDLDVTDRLCAELDVPVIRFYHNGYLQEADVIFNRDEVKQRLHTLSVEVVSGYAD